MTLGEFSSEFDILYNNVLSGAAPGINNYEKSLFLTNAQEDLVKAYYSGNIQTLLPGFEQDEKKRRELGELVRSHTSTYDPALNASISDRKINEKSIFFKIPSDVWFIVHESGTTYDDPCTDKGRYIKIYPVKHDYVNTQVKNPFRKPLKDSSWRLDLEAYGASNIVEIVHFTIPLRKYFIRYIHEPSPIILTDFESDPELSGMGLTIRGKNTTSNTELTHVDYDILKLAVESAIVRYRENSIQNIQTLK